MSIYIAVDLGGTHIRAASYHQNDTTPIRYKKIKTRVENQKVFSRILSVITDVIPEDEQVAAIGIAAPGPINPRTGVVIETPNIPEWEDFPLTEKLSRHFGIPAYLGNDANLAGLGEWRYGAGKSHNHLLYLTISTGVGGGVISEGHLLEGAHGLGGELGHVTVLVDGPLCSCGHRGHLEALASGTAIANYVREQLDDPTRESSLRSRSDRGAKSVAEAAREGDPLAVEAYQRAGKYLGIGIANFLHIFNPSIVILGGGVSYSGEILFAPMRESIQKNAFNKSYLEDLVITAAALGDDAGLLGALALAVMKKTT